MNQKELAEINSKREIKQIAFVTRDLYATLEKWVNVLKIGPWKVMKFSDETLKDFYVKGKPVTESYGMLVGLCDVGNINFEIIQPLTGNTIYDDFIEKHGEGLHHIKEKIADDEIRNEIKKYQDGGIDILQTGLFYNDLHCYLNTSPILDFIFEIGNSPHIEVPKEMVSWYPAE